MPMHKTALALLAVVLPASSGSAQWSRQRDCCTLTWDLRADVARLTLFREETFLNSGHRNTFRHNRVLDNGGAQAGYGFGVLPSAGVIVLEANQIANTRPNRVQRYGLYRASGAGSVWIDGQPMVGATHD